MARGVWQHFAVLWCGAMICLPDIALAQQIYRRILPNGAVEYSTSAEERTEQPAALPELGRENLDKKIKEIEHQTPPSCVEHGGVDCSRGRDSDGSVICLDGYRGALLPFRFHCLEAELAKQIKVRSRGEENFSPLSSLKELKTLADKLEALQITVRNLSAVEAWGLKVSFRLPRDIELPISGPDHIPAYGIADFSASKETLQHLLSVEKPEQLRLKVLCINCRRITDESS